MRLLFLCTHNACRSILGEVITRKLAAPRIEAASAGSQPAGQVHPLTLSFLRKNGYATAGLHSKAIDDLRDFAPDLVVTVCDSAAGESCPLWLGGTETVHWGLPDPSRVHGSDADIETAFSQVAETITDRITRLLKEPFEQLQNSERATLLRRIGEMS